jgi:hypothetical protein
LKLVLALFNNSAFAAFIGAFSAFMLVIINDWRRERRTICTIKNEIKMNGEHAKGKLDALKMNRAALTDHNKVIPSSIIRFSSDVIRALSTSVLHRLSPDHRRALDALCYMMEATDNLLADAHKTAERFRPGGGLSDEERPIITEELLTYYEDGITNMNRLIKMCDLYEEGNYRTILTRKYNVEDYVPPDYI